MPNPNDNNGMAMEDTTAKPPVNAPTSAVLESPDPEGQEHMEPESDDEGSEGS